MIISAALESHLNLKHSRGAKMARIMMKNKRKEASLQEVFDLFLAAAAARGVREKSMETYQQHFHSIGKRLDLSIPAAELKKADLDEMIFRMREENLSDRSINSYTRTLKVFLSWCNEEHYTDLNISLYKAAEAVKETYTDRELEMLLKRPAASCNFCEFRNWTIVNFLLNCGCRAATVRNIQLRDVDLGHRQIQMRHSKNGKLQIIPLCSTMVSILREYMEIRSGAPEDYLFCNEFGGFLTESALRQAIAKYNRARGVERTSIHCFRHTFARKYLVDCGGDAFTLQKLMGHATLNMTRHYCNIYDAEVVDNYEHLSPLAQLKKAKGEYIRK